MSSETIHYKSKEIFNVTEENFEAEALSVFAWQAANNTIYQRYCQQIGRGRNAVNSLKNIPFLPISFFKTHNILIGTDEPEIIFTSSGTSGMQTSRHLVKKVALYEESFLKGFIDAYGDPSEYAFLCLLPSYLERNGSSLIYMAERLVALSNNADSGFYLQANDELVAILQKREAAAKKTILIGVTFALLDFVAARPIPLKHTIVMETGGMKGRRQELTRQEVHDQLKTAFNLPAIHSEYGMTELLSQAYASKDGLFTCPPWMKVFVRSADDPFELKSEGTGLLCIIDLANIYSCAFIETADVARIHTNGSFEVLGRLDNSDIRGCSLLVAEGI